MSELREDIKAWLSAWAEYFTAQERAVLLVCIESDATSSGISNTECLAGWLSSITLPDLTAILRKARAAARDKVHHGEVGSQSKYTSITTAVSSLQLTRLVGFAESLMQVHDRMEPSVIVLMSYLYSRDHAVDGVTIARELNWSPTKVSYHMTLLGSGHNYASGRSVVGLELIAESEHETDRRRKLYALNESGRNVVARWMEFFATFS